MGGKLSSEEKTARTRSAKKKHRNADTTLGVPWDSHGYRYRENIRSRGRRSAKKGIQREEDFPDSGRTARRGRSHSLDAILEELYLSENEGDNLKGPIIPRAKLNGSSRDLEEKLQSRRGLPGFMADTASLHAIHMQVEQKNLQRHNHNLKSSLSLPFLDHSNWEDDIEMDRTSMEPSSFSQDFDACMKQLADMQNSEKSSTERTNEDPPMPKARTIKRQQTPTKDSLIPPPEVEKIHSSDSEEKSEEIEAVINPVLKNLPQEKILIVEPETSESKEPEPTRPRGWYCNLKEQFERLDKELGVNRGKKDISCRITGATLKNNKADNHINEDKEAKKKHYFSQLVRSNKSLIDEELPDPDKVQNIRAMFQEQYNRLGGSLQNINTTRFEVKPERPKSAQASRKEDEIRCLSPDSVDGDTPSSNPQRNTASRLRNRMEPQRRWTDTGSMSSGVSSDFSSCEMDHESCTREPTEQISSDEETDDTSKHHIQSEVLEKIRAFGTSVTYFGGEMIRCSVGPLVSPTTHAILEEIGQRQPSGIPKTRSFDEFYKKYHEATKKRKVGRTHSFAQEEMYNKSNVFNDSEIDEHKTELENAFGIRRPKGKQQTFMKGKLEKSLSLDSRILGLEKALANQMNSSRPIKTVRETCLERANFTTKPFSEFNNIRNFRSNGDMDFEEFEVLGSTGEKNPLQKNGLNLENKESNLQLNTSGTKLAKDKPDDEGIQFENPSEPGERKNVTNHSRDENETSYKRNSVQEQLTSWEEAIQRKRLSTENQLNERKDGVGVLGKRNSRDSTSSEVSQLSRSTEELINSFEDKQSPVENQNKPPGSDCSSESTHSIDFEHTGKPNNKTDTWGRQAQLRRNSHDDDKYNSGKIDCENSQVEFSSGTWKQFMASRRFRSTENLSLRSSQDDEKGSSRSSIKKLPFDFENGTGGCQDFRRLSLDSKKSRWNFGMNNSSAIDFQRRSSTGGEDNFSRKNSSESRSSARKRSVFDGSRRGSRKDKNEENADDQRMQQTLKATDSEERYENKGKNGNTKDKGEYKITIRISQSEAGSYKIGNEEFEEIVLHDQDQVDSLELYFPKPGEKVLGTQGDTNVAKEDFIKQSNESNEEKSEHTSITEYKRRFDKNKSYKSPSRWPLETTVMVDMEKNEEMFPKLISSGKSSVKTKKRLF